VVCFRVVKTYYYTSVGSSSLHCFVLDALLGGGAYASSAANISRRYRSCSYLRNFVRDDRKREQRILLSNFVEHNMRNHNKCWHILAGIAPSKMIYHTRCLW
jgi:hypothetical protein